MAETDKEARKRLEEELDNLTQVFESEKQMNKYLQNHISNLEFQVETQSNLLDKFCVKIGNLRHKLKEMIKW